MSKVTQLVCGTRQVFKPKPLRPLHRTTSWVKVPVVRQEREQRLPRGGGQPCPPASQQPSARGFSLEQGREGEWEDSGCDHWAGPGMMSLQPALWVGFT